MKLDDQFEWDIENPGASPEQFAEVYARELGLGTEFRWVYDTVWLLEFF
jgi:SWI/SNF-related matrix-associated actin-dependent regulator of chromatin subfamily B member 1